MVLSDFLLRQKTDDSNPHEIIPISFTLRRVLHENYYRLNDLTETPETEADKYLVQTMSQAKSSVIIVPEVHGMDNGLILHIKPEHQKSVVALTTCPTPPAPLHTRPTHHTQPMDQGLPKNVVQSIPKPRIGQGIRRKPMVSLPIPKPIQTPVHPIPTPSPRAVQSLPEPVVQSQERTLPQHHVPTVPVSIIQPTPASITQPVRPRVEHRSIPPYHEPLLRPPPRSPDATGVKDNRKDLLDLDTDRNIAFEENLPYQEGIILEMYERPDKSYIQEPMELKDLIDTTKLIQKFLPKQTDTDKILDLIQRKLLKHTHLPLTIHEVQDGYLTSPYFKDLYLYLAQNKLPS